MIGDDPLLAAEGVLDQAGRREIRKDALGIEPMLGQREALALNDDTLNGHKLHGEGRVSKDRQTGRPGQPTAAAATPGRIV